MFRSNRVPSEPKIGRGRACHSEEYETASPFRILGDSKATNPFPTNLKKRARPSPLIRSTHSESGLRSHLRMAWFPRMEKLFSRLCCHHSRMSAVGQGSSPPFK